MLQARLEAGREVARRGPGELGGLFVPECQPSGQYSPVQCYRWGTVSSPRDRVTC